MSRIISKNNEGVNIILEYLLMMVITIIMFSTMVLLLNDIQNRTDRIVLNEEFEIISNDIANRLSTFSSELYLNQHMDDDEKAIIDDQNAGRPDQEIYFDLPELVKGKQYNVKIEHISGNIYTVTVASTSNSDIVSKTTFSNKAQDDLISINEIEFNSQPGKYMISYDKDNKLITMVGIG
ncbi:conserved hypothetical protein [Methanocella paludicola SANAE]|uniref:Uncharacterized protein n=1 Tax=Methanocella paludicola (strain DSM 17711 / JCM 13418 / NBRC 101707 / SANAE) TaxID=304371 RepID=D1YV63_METPS|nr:hypothetical protein [Methanocella paludicola]BAI60335.1 conserved hypothetical protein [Methanocella paludicola SANAE]